MPRPNGESFEGSQADGNASRRGGGNRHRGRVDPFRVPPPIPHQRDESTVPAPHVQEAGWSGPVPQSIEVAGRFPEDFPHEAIPARLLPAVPGVIPPVEPGEILLRRLRMNVDQPASTAADDGVSVPYHEGLRRITAAEDAWGETRLRHVIEPKSPGATR